MTRHATAAFFAIFLVVTTLTASPVCADLYVSARRVTVNGEDGNVFHYTNDGGLINTFNQLSFPVTGLVVGPDGTLYAGLFTGVGGGVGRFDRVGNFLGYFIPPSVTLPMPEGLAIGPDGDFYVAIAGSVVRYDSTGTIKSLIRLTGPKYLAFGPDGNLYISDVNTNSVWRYTPDTGVTIRLVTVLGQIASVALDLAGNLYVVDNMSAPVAAARVERYDAGGRFLGAFVPVGAGGLSAGTDLGFGPDGNLYVLDSSGNQVLRYRGIDGAPLGSADCATAVSTACFIRPVDPSLRTLGPGYLAFSGGVRPGLGDINGDQRIDIPWRETVTSGGVAVWFLNGTTTLTTAVVGTAALDWTIVGVGDFNGDGRADILWRHTTGLLYVWLMNGASVIGTLALGSAGTDWSVVGVGDFNGDGRADILWRHTSGVLEIWLLGGSGVIGTGSPGSAGIDWSIVGVGDFNGDGFADILWRHTSGQVYEWLLNGIGVIGTGSPGSASNDWRIVGVGDFNGDGRADILWRHTSGQVQEWLLNGTSVIGTGSPGSADNSWRIVGVGDFNGDRKADILWRHTSGQVFEWLLNGTSLIGTGSPGTTGITWVIQ